jgi:hypothetical protein
MMLHQRSRSLTIYFCWHRSSDFISRGNLTKLYTTSVQYGKISNEFAFHDAASKVKVTVTIFRKCLSSLSRRYFSNDFDETSHKCLVWQSHTIIDSRGFVSYAISCFITDTTVDLLTNNLKS